MNEDRDLDHPALLDLTVREFLDALGSPAPTPGGGAGAALAGGLAAALVEMTANLTMGRPRYADQDAQARSIAERAATLRRQFQAYVVDDSEAYGRVAVAYKLPRRSDEERQARLAAIQLALSDAAEVPLQVARTSAEVLALCEEAAPILNAGVISDVLVGALLARAALESAGLNVEVNVATMADRVRAAELESALEEVREGLAERVERVLAVGRERMPRTAV